MIKTKPILFSTESVNGIMPGVKTQTRRMINPQIKPCEHHLYEEAEWKDEPTQWVIKPTGHAYCAICGNGITPKDNYQGIKSPYQVGDICWIRETWGTPPPYGERPSITCGKDQPYTIHKKSGFTEPVIHKAGKEKNAWGMYGPPKWKSPRFMPKTAARLWVKITGIRVERLNDISREDAIAEGVGRWVEERMRSKPIHYQLYWTEPGDESIYSSCPILSYESLWKKINGQDSWDANPWVWVYTFEKTEKPDESKV